MNKVVFIGAGPGDPELITLKGKKWLEQADVVIYAGSLLNPEYLKYCKKGVELHDSAKMGLPEMLKVMVEGVKARKLVARLHDGDPSFYGAIQEVMTALDKEGYYEPDHTIRFTGTTAGKAADPAYSDAVQKALFPGGDAQFHVTGGVGLVVNEHFQLDTAANVADKNKQFSVSAVYRF